MEEIKWRFPGNNYTSDTGLDTADMETFKKDTMSSLARELCQNSIDAKRENVVAPVKVEFKSFEVDRNEIPGINQIQSEIDNCYDTWNTPGFNGKLLTQLLDMKEAIREDKIFCLRISDFNTTGLVGVSGKEKSPWRYLVHGSGISDKGSTSGGSKGIGKFATFVASKFNTVFYSTVTMDGESGYEGICKLCSAKMPNTTEKTQGIGYYGSNNKNESNEGQLILDKSFNRTNDDYGTDVYIVGFKNPTGWKKDIISKILDSFMSAIVFNTLEITVDGIIINKDTLKDIVYDYNLINDKNKKSIISQYLLLTDVDHRYEDTIVMDDGLGNVKLYLLEFDENNENLATNNCVMIRYPYMKIKDIKRISTLPCSAMCIIENNDLNKIVRSIENPQHTDWEFNRIENEDKKREVKNIYNELKDKIIKIITNHLITSDDYQTDIEGAGDYIPGISEGKSEANKEITGKIMDKPEVSKNKVKTKTFNINASIPDENGDGVGLDVGTFGNEGEEFLSPEGENNGTGGVVTPGTNTNQAKTEDNGNVIMKHEELRGMKYRFMCLNKAKGEYMISFISDCDEQEVSLELYALDDGNNRYPVDILECYLNDKKIDTNDNQSIKFSISHGVKYKIRMITNQTELFSGEVKVYAYR